MILQIRQQRDIYKLRQKSKPKGKEPNPEGFPTHKLAAKRRKILVHDVITLLPFLAEASQLQHMAACKKLHYYSAGKAHLILLSLLRSHKEGFNKLFLQHTLTVVLRWLEIRIRAGVGAGAGVGRAGLDRLNPP